MKPRKALPRVFNPIVAQYEVATGQPYGHKVQKRSLCDTESDHREKVSSTELAHGPRGGEACLASAQGLERKWVWRQCGGLRGGEACLALAQGLERKRVWRQCGGDVVSAKHQGEVAPRTIIVGRI